MVKYGAPFRRIVRTPAGNIFLQTQDDCWSGRSEDGRTVTAMEADDGLWYARIEGLDEELPGCRRLKQAIEQMFIADKNRLARIP